MEGPHGSGGPEPPETIAWLWGFMHGACFAALAMGFLMIAVEYSAGLAIGSAMVTSVILMIVLGWAWDREPIEH